MAPPYQRIPPAAATESGGESRNKEGKGEPDNSGRLLEGKCTKWNICLLLLAITFVISVTSCANKLRNNPARELLASPEPSSIDLAYVCSGANSTRNLYTLQKSILFHHQPARAHMRLHIFADRLAKASLELLFATWRVTGLTVHLYDRSKYVHLINWVPNEHYSSVDGALKLVVPEVLRREGVRRIIVLDTDTLMLGDIERLYSRGFAELDGAPPEAFMALVENQSDWYNNSSQPNLRTARPHWPSIGRGLNTGVMLMDLQRHSFDEWPRLWRAAAERELVQYLKTDLADQDIVNAAIRMRPSIYVKLGCLFNLQLNDNSDLDSSCPGHLSNGWLQHGFRLIHWNSRSKFATRNRYAQHYNNLHATFESMDGKLLAATDTIGQSDASSPVKFWSSRMPETCGDLRPRPDEPLRTFTYFWDFKQEDYQGKIDVTLVVQLSFDRFRKLDELAANWPGPISAAIYLPEPELGFLVQSIRNSENLSGRKNIGYHLVFKERDFKNYPINKLRNLALEQAESSHVYLSDVDFLPALKLRDYLVSAIRDTSGPAELTAFVIPAFEEREYKFEFPRHKGELLRQLDEGTVNKFRDLIWAQGQNATQYDRWRRATKPYEVTWAPDFEPFVTARKDGLPRFDERFVGFGWNKAEHAMTLAAMGYKFIVQPEAFAIHQFHGASYDISVFRHSHAYQVCIRQLKDLFESELRALHPQFFARHLKGTSFARLVL